MPCQSKLAECLPCGYGYVVLTATGHVFLNMWLAMNVVQARKKFKVEYPTLYADEEKKEFNCIQRAHQHTLEIYPQFICLLLLGGLQLPPLDLKRFYVVLYLRIPFVLSAGAGVVYLVGRVVAAKGYYTGDPDKRKYGAFGMLGMLVLLGNTFCFAFHQLKWNPLKAITSCGKD